MNYLLDTCVISELVKKKPNKNVTGWISSISEDSLFLSVFTFAELYKSVEKLTNSKRKKELHSWVSKDLIQRFEGRIIDFNLETSNTWGKVIAKVEKNGTSLSLMDGIIAVTGLTYNLVVVTQNIKDMKNSGVALLNPWEDN